MRGDIIVGNIIGGAIVLVRRGERVLEGPGRLLTKVTGETVRLGQGMLLKTGATVLEGSAETGLEAPERLLTTGATSFEGSDQQYCRGHKG